MLEKQTIKKFFIRCMLGFFTLVILSSYFPFDKGVSEIVCKHGAYWFSSLSFGGNVYFNKVDKETKENVQMAGSPDFVMNLTSRKLLENAPVIVEKGGRYAKELICENIWYNTRISILLPMMMLLALILATPNAPKEKIMAVIFGLGLFYCFTFFVLYVYIIYMYQTSSLFQKNETSDFNPIDPIPYNESLIEITHFLFVENMLSITLVPVVIWILVSFRKSDWIK